MPSPIQTQTLTATGTTTPISATDQGFGTIAVQIGGTFSVLAATFQGSLDGVTYFPIGMYSLDQPPSTAATTASAVGIFRTIDATGINYFRINVGTLTGTNVIVQATWNAIS